MAGQLVGSSDVSESANRPRATLSYRYLYVLSAKVMWLLSANFTKPVL